MQAVDEQEVQMEISSGSPELNVPLVSIERENEGESESENEDPTSDSEEVHDDYFDEEVNTQEKIRRYCIKHKLNTRAVKDLLDLFHQLGHTELPKTYVTLMKTPVNVYNFKYVAPGEYYHVGLETIAKELHSVFDVQNNEMHVNIVFHIDGISLSDSSNLQGWTILGEVKNFPELEPFLVGIFVGYSGPEDFDSYLEDLGNDIRKGQSEGFDVNETKKVFFHVSFFVSDAPARSKISHTMGCAALKGCPYCSQLGVKQGFPSTQYAPEIVLPLRTDESYVSRVDEGHFHKKYRPNHGTLHKGQLEEAGVKMVSQLVPCSMHSVDLGNMKKILKIVFQKKGYSGYYTFSAEELKLIDERYVAIKPFNPCEFARVPRGISDNLPHFKATECRGITVYHGSIVFKDIFPTHQYQHFLCLSASIRLLSDATATPEALNIAQLLIESYVKNFSTYYGNERSYVVHTLLHFKAYVEKYGPIYSFSAYKFENALHFIKNMIHVKNRVLSQIRRRLAENGILKIRTKSPNGVKNLINIEENIKEFSSYQINNTVFKADKANCYAMIQEDDEDQVKIAKLIKFRVSMDDSITVQFKTIEILGPFYRIHEFDLDSSDLGVFLCSNEDSADISETPVKNIMYKLVSSPFKAYRVMQKMIHTSDYD